MTLSKPRKEGPKGRLTGELAAQLNQNGWRDINDESPLQVIYHYAKYGQYEIQRRPGIYEQWRQAVVQLNITQRTMISTALFCASWDFDTRTHRDLTVGNVRSMSIDDLRQLPGVGIRSANFLKEVFQTQPPIQNT